MKVQDGTYFGIRLLLSPVISAANKFRAATENPEYILYKFNHALFQHDQIERVKSGSQNQAADTAKTQRINRIHPDLFSHFDILHTIVSDELPQDLQFPDFRTTVSPSDSYEEIRQAHTELIRLVGYNPVISRILTGFLKNPRIFDSFDLYREDAEMLDETFSAIREALSFHTLIIENHPESGCADVSEQDSQKITLLAGQIALYFRERAKGCPSMLGDLLDKIQFHKETKNDLLASLLSRIIYEKKNYKKNYEPKIIFNNSLSNIEKTIFPK